ncbi:hypothetical protein PS15p_200316 [Mucor circinelloides]
MATNSLTNNTTNSTTCSTPECTTLANAILGDLDLNVDPCSDFYQYTCGGWLAKTTIPDDKVSAGALETANDVNTQVMRSILEGTYDDVYENLAGSDKGFYTQDQQDADQENFDTMQKYYQVCLNKDRIDSLGPTPIYQDVANLENMLFPVENDMQAFSNKTTPLLSQTLAKLNQLSVAALNVFYINPDDKHPDVNAILVDQVSLGLPSKEYYEVPETLAKYKTGLNDILAKTIGTYSNGTDDATLRDSESKKYNFTRWSTEKIAAAVDRFIDFETKLANISLKAEEMRDPVKLYNPVKLSAFQANNSYVDWTSLIAALVPSGIQPPDSVVIRATPYFERLNALFSSSNVTERTLQEYCIITFVTKKIYALDSTSREASRKMDGEISSGITTERPRWETCTNYVSNVISNSMGRFYVLKKFGGEVERKKVETFLTNIHETWLGRLNEIDWLDNQTRAKAIEKVNLIKHQAAYSTVSPDLRQPNAIKEYNEGIYINETSYYDTEDLLTTWYTRKLWGKAGQPVDRDEWLLSPQTVNAYYSPNSNQIALLAGILVNPLYNTSQPEYLNYGGIGMVAGHEITHAFDSIGRKYDGKGVLTDWWTNATAARFEEKTKCFIDQYSKFTVSGPNNSTLNVNGLLTLSENLADNGGASIALSAYKKLAKQEEVLPGLESLSVEALFFVNLGRSWCSKQRDEIAQQSIYVDVHSPTTARVNGIVQNSAEFAKAFNCPAGSPMNPQTKCTMW